MLPVKTVDKVLVSTEMAYRHLHYDSQRPPFTLLLAMDNRYHGSTWMTIAGSNYGGNTLPANRSWPLESANGMVPGDLLGIAANRSYAKLVGKLGDASQMGSTLTAERRETWNTFVTIIIRVLRSARFVSRMNLAAAARELGLPYYEYSRRLKSKWIVVRTRDGQKRFKKIRTGAKVTYFRFGTGRDFLKTIGNGWLMWSYGVKPLMDDLYNCMDVLQRPFPFIRIFGANTQQSTYTTASSPSSSPQWRKLCAWKVSVRQAIDVRVANPNLWLANRLGLVNPAQMILEAIPFSFVVDWFSNLSEVVMSLTDFVGLETQNPCVNTAGTLVETENVWFPTWVSGWYHTESVRHSNYRRRVLGLKTPKLKFAYERFQWQRGANAISLLLGILPKR